MKKWVPLWALTTLLTIAKTLYSKETGQFVNSDCNLMLTVGSKLVSDIQSPAILISYVKQQDIRKRQQKLGATSPVSGFMWGIKQGAHAFSFNIGHMHHYRHQKDMQKYRTGIHKFPTATYQPQELLFSAALLTTTTAKVFTSTLSTSFAWRFKELMHVQKQVLFEKTSRDW